MVHALPANSLGNRLNELHHANLAGDPTASAEIFSLAFGPLSRQLKKARPSADGEQLNDAATDAIVTYLQKPEVFDLQKGSLWTFLCTIAARRLSDLRRSAGRE